MASEWFLYTIYLSLVGLFPTVGHTKKAVIPTPGLFIEPTMRLFRLIIYVEIKENLTYIASTTTTKKSQDTRTTGAIVSRGHKYFADTHKKNTMKS